MATTINERIRRILNVVYKGNVTAMSKGTCIKRTTLSSVIGADGNAPGSDIILKIAEIPSHHVSMEWLIRGVGGMFLDEKSESISNSGINGDNNSNNSVNDTDTLNRLLGLVETKDRQIEAKDKQIGILLEIVKGK